MVFKKILAAIDHSSFAEAVFDQALELAQQNGAELLLYNCLSLDLLTGPILLPGELGLSPNLMSQAYQAQQLQLEQQTRQIQELLSSYCEVARQRGVVAQFNYRCIDPGQGLCQAAKNWGADLIVMGRRGRKGWSEALLGSVSNYVLHRAPCTVMVIQPTDKTVAPAEVLTVKDAADQLQPN